MALKVINIKEWIEENKKDFLPPVCNKMMHGKDQLKVFFVGGPNVRKDYHLEEGEEFFYMLRGDMCLKVVEEGHHKDILIREGDVFLLPANVCHSPQRFANTVGLVIERQRLPNENDGLIYFVEKDGQPTNDILLQRYFYGEDLEKQLKNIVDECLNTEACRTGRPSSDAVPVIPLVLQEASRRWQKPFNLNDWLEQHSAKLDNEIGQNSLDLFDVIVGQERRFVIQILGAGEFQLRVKNAETWILILVGKSQIRVEDETFSLQQDDSILIPIDKEFFMEQQRGCRALLCNQPTRCG